MKLTKSFLILFGVWSVWIAAPVFPQPVRGTVLEMPGICNAPIESTLVVLREQYTGDRLPSQIWVVYSDRDRNFTCQAPGSSAKLRENIPFMEPFMVLEERGQFLHLVRDRDITRLDLSNSAEDWGWMDKDRLLLWRNCLLSNSRINKKGMILNTVARIREIQRGQMANVVEFKADPNPRSDLSTGNRSLLYNFYFVYKIAYRSGGTVPEAVLLGKEYRLKDVLDAKQLRDSMVGWAPANRVTFWDHRVAVEANWAPEAAAERRAGKKAKAFINLARARDYRDGQPVAGNQIVWEADPLDVRMPGAWRRFPLLDSSLDRSIAVAGVMGQIVSPGERGPIDEILMAKLQQIVERGKAQKRQINVLFIVDGTKSMGQYAPAVRDGINHAIANLVRKEAGNKFRFALAIYRDYREGNEKLFQHLSLGSDVPGSEELKKLEHHENDRDEPEALYYGLSNALSEAGLDSTQTNIAILIGDAGNRIGEDENHRRTAIDLLSKYRCGLLVYQAHYKGTSRSDRREPSTRGDDYRNFLVQLKDIAKSAASINYERNKEAARLLRDIEYRDPDWIQAGRMSRIQGGFNIGAWVVPADQWPERRLPADTLTAGIERFLTFIDARNDSLIKKLGDIINGSALTASGQQEGGEFEDPGNLGGAVLQMLIEMGLTEEQIKLLLKDRYQVYVPSPVVLKVANQNQPLFRKVMLFSREELGYLCMRLEELSRAASGTGVRQSIYNSWISMVKSVDGSLTEQMIAEMPMERLFQIAGGLPVKSEFIRRIRPRDILDPRQFSDEKVGKYSTYLRSREQQLRKIFRSNTDDAGIYAFYSNEVPYFWIDEDDLF